MAEQNRLTQNQQYLLDKVRRSGRRRATNLIKKAQLGRRQKEAFEHAKDKLRTAPVIMNRDLKEMGILQHLIDSLLRTKRFYNQMEIGDFPGGIRDARLRTRLMVEFKLYGGTADLQVVLNHMMDTERPVYAALDYIGTPHSLAPLRHWGWYRFRLRDEVKERCTFTPTDSFFAEREQVFLWKDIDGILATQTTPNRYWFEYVNEGREPFSMIEGVSYIEAQILGGVTLSDVNRLYYPEADRMDMQFFDALQKLQEGHGIELISY